MAPSITITLNNGWRRKQVPIEVIIARFTFRSVSFIALDKTFSGTLPQWLFLRDSQPAGRPRRRGASR